METPLLTMRIKQDFPENHPVQTMLRARVSDLWPSLPVSLGKESSALRGHLATAYTIQESDFSLFKLHHLDLAVVTNCSCQVIGFFFFPEKRHRSNSKFFCKF